MALDHPLRPRTLRSAYIRSTAAPTSGSPASDVITLAHPKVISDQLGHASVQITMDRYAHLFDHACSDVSEELEKAWTATETAAETMTTAVVSR